jgi:hemerythrin
MNNTGSNKHRLPIHGLGIPTNERQHTMAEIIWDDSLSVNVAEIDQQHQRFISIANALSDSLRQCKGPHSVANVINELIDYAEVHFKTEEKYFDRFGYPDAGSHKVEHSVFLDRISAVKSRLDEGEGILSLEMLRFVSNWLLNHINSSDKKYSKFLNDNGLR